MNTIMATILATAEYYGRQLSETVLKMYAKDLADLDPGEVVAAYDLYRHNPANRQFPLPAQIRELINPEEFISAEAQAREIAARIIGTVKMFGWNNAVAAEKFIGPIGWQAIQRRGGWADLCQNLGENLSETTLQAQMRDLIESNIRYGTADLEESIGAKSLTEVRREGKLIGIGSGIRSLIPNRDPEGAA